MKSALKIKKVSIVDRGIFYEQLHYTLLVFCVNKKAAHNRVTFDNPFHKVILAQKEKAHNLLTVSVLIRLKAFQLGGNLERRLPLCYTLIIHIYFNMYIYFFSNSPSTTLYL